ncbi:hypothetical protein [Paenibacillus motobuensis]|uniref:Uncharacterized protein n=1 Tax=Paenibacillus motobuensis TaxID=295324 RepID=A0ABN0Y6T2_9BACL
MNQQLITNISEMVFLQRQHHFISPDAVIYHPGHFPELNSKIVDLYKSEGFKQLLIPNIYNCFLEANEFVYHKPLLVEMGIPEELICPISGDFKDGSEVVVGGVSQLDPGMHNILLAGKAFFCRRFMILAALNRTDKTFDVLPLVDERGIDKDNWHTTEKGRARVLNEINVINKILNCT